MPGTLIAIGGNEDRSRDSVILRELVRRLDGERIAVATAASSDPSEMWRSYEDVFRRLGVGDVTRLDVRSRDEALSGRWRRSLEGAAGVFFTGGSQETIARRICGSPLHDHLLEMYAGGALLAGTSAGASLMSEVMLASGDSRTCARAGAARLGTGIGCLKSVIIDQHFSERGRIGRLTAAVTQKPELVGLGIDEDTAIVVDGGGTTFSVFGRGAVYAIHFAEAHPSHAEVREGTALSAFGLRMDVLAHGDSYDLQRRMPGATQMTAQ